MASVKNRYPLSTSDGQYIPLAVVRPASCLLQSILTASGSAAQDVPADVDFFQVFADQDFVIQFAASSASAAAPVSGTPVTDGIILQKNVTHIVSPPIDKKSFSLRAVTVNGTALISFLEPWNALSLQSQITRR